MSSQKTAKLSNFHEGEIAQAKVRIALKMSQNIPKSTTYIINKLGGDFQQAGCLYNPTIDTQ